MQAYVYGKKRGLPAGFEEFAEKEKTAIVSIDMHQGHLADTPDCPCPAPRARDIVEPINAFHDEARRVGVPIVHVRTVLRQGGVDDVKGLKAAWRLVFPLYVGDIANADAHALQGSRWTEFVTRVDPRDLIVETKKRLSVFYPTDLDFLLRNMGVRTVVLNGGFTDCCVLNQPSMRVTTTITWSFSAIWCAGRTTRWRTPPSRWCRCIWGSSWIPPICSTRGKSVREGSSRRRCR